MNLYIDDKKSSIDEVRERLGIERRDIPFSHLNKVFERIGARKFDPANKREIRPSGVALPSSFVATDTRGENIRIRYVSSAIQRPGSSNLDIQYKPFSIPFFGTTTHIEEAHKALFFFLYVNPSNKQSPLNRGKPNPPVVYEFIDREQRAKDELALEDTRYEALTTFRSLGDKQIRQLAKGYGAQGVDNMSIYEVQMYIRGKITANPEGFIDDVNNNVIALRGIVRDAIDKGVLRSSDTGNGKLWRVGDEEIIRTKLGEDEVVKISMVVAGDMETWFDKLDGGIENIDGKKVLSKPENDKYFGKFKPQNETDYKSFTGSDIEAAKVKYHETAEFKEKIDRWAREDLTNPDLHPATRKAMEDPKNIPFIEARRAELALEAQT